jgi:predicted MFS family arabinose efflux permease
LAAVAAAVILMLCHLLSGWVERFETLLLVRILAGFAGGSMMSIALTCLGDTRNPDRFFALFISAQLGLGAIGLAFLPDVIARFGLHGAFLSLALLVGVAIAAIPFIPRAGDFEGPVSLRGVPLRKMIPGAAALLACFLFDLGIMMVWAYTERMGHAAGLEAGFIGKALAASMIAALFGSLLAAAMGARFGRVLPLGITLVLQAAALWMLGGALSQQAYFLGVMLFSFAWNFPVAFQLAITVSVDVSGRLVVLFLSAVKLGYAAAPALAALLIAGDGGLRSLLLVSAAAYLVSGVIFAALAARKAKVTVEA